MTRISALILAGVLASSNTAQADLKTFHYQRMLKKQAEAGSAFGNLMQLFSLQQERDATQDTAELTFEQRVNHEDASDTRTFNQRYFINSTYASGPDAPVLYLICGEATCSASEFRGSSLAHAKKYKAHLITLEHRYYGKSQPFPTLAPENMKYLSTPQALADLAAFQLFATVKHQLTGKWVTIGGSYAGSLAAYYRQRFPALTEGSLSSSGPVMAKADFEEYDQTVSRVAGQQCADAIRGVVAKVEATLDNPDALLAMKKIFKAEGVRDSVDFLYNLADMAAIAVQYGQRDRFCNTLVNAADPVQGYADVGLQLFEAFGLTPVTDSFQGAESLNPDDYIEAFGMRSWMWQSCTEYGYWQVAYHDPAVTTRSKLIDQKYHDGVCTRLFGLKDPVDTARVNDTLYRPLLDPSTSRILYTNGSTDPWAALSITQANANDVNPNTQSLLIDGGSHCSDLGSLAQTGSIAQAQGAFAALLESWIK